MSSIDRTRHVQSLTNALNASWGIDARGNLHECGHCEHMRGCVFCVLLSGHREVNARTLRRLLGEERRRLIDTAQERVRLRKERETTGKRTAAEPIRKIAEDILHAAGVVEVRMGLQAPLSVHPEGMLGRTLRDDEACEVVQSAEDALKATRGWRTHVDWTQDPPVLYVAKIASQMKLAL